MAIRSPRKSAAPAKTPRKRVRSGEGKPSPPSAASKARIKAGARAIKASQKELKAAQKELSRDERDLAKLAALERRATRQGLVSLSKHERRLVKAYRRGAKSVSEARGHKPVRGKSESQIRRERRDARIDAFAEQQAAKFKGADAGEIAEALHEMVKLYGMKKLAQLQAEIARMHADWLNMPRDKKGRHVAAGYNLDELSERYELPAETFGYH